MEAKQAKMKTRAIRGYVKCTTTALEPGKGYTKRGNKVLNERYRPRKSTSARYISIKQKYPPPPLAVRRPSVADLNSGPAGHE